MPPYSSMRPRRGQACCPSAPRSNLKSPSLPAEEKAEFLEGLGIAESGLNKLIKESYSLLGLISYLTAGPKEVRAWTIKKGTKAPQAAGQNPHRF